jgi:hypothetical protein
MSKRPNDIAARRQRYVQALEVFSKPPADSWKQLMVAICLTKLDDYAGAQKSYGLSLQNALRDRWWHFTGEVYSLVDTYVLANLPDCLSQVSEEVEAYKLDRRGDSLAALYAYSIVCLLLGRDEEATGHVLGLLKKPKVKWTLAAGKTVRALLERDQLALDAALDELLKAHRGMAKVGGLRETPEGFLCLPAMSLSRMAGERGMAVNAESEYLCTGYLEFLEEQAITAEGQEGQND